MKKAKKFSISVLLTIFFFAAFFSYGKTKKEELKYAIVVFPSGVAYTVEVADTWEKQVKGLMFRKKLPEKGGMLFTYPKEDFYYIWMKNCYIPLDILWLDSKGRIIYIIEKAPPCNSDPCPSYGPMMKARYVIELKAGSVKKLNLKLGERISIIFPSDTK